MGATKVRRYRSALRDQQASATRRAILEAARDLFLAKGWTATGMRDVAAAAGVALETVYAHFSSKKGLLRAVADVAAVGDDAQVPLGERPEFLAIGKGRRAERIRAAAALLTAVHERTREVAVLLRQAAPADEETAEMLAATRDRQWVDVARAVELVIGRPPTRAETDGVWAISSPELYLLLVEQRGWTRKGYESWIAGVLKAVIP